jgi:hypothetical protein
MILVSRAFVPASARTFVTNVTRQPSAKQDFYYFFKASPDKNTVQQDKMEDGKPVVHMNMVMEQSVDSRLYHYIMSGMDD